MSPPMKQPSLWEPSKLLKPYKYVIKSSFFQIDHGCLYMEDCSIGSNNQVLRKVIVCNKIFLLETLFNLQVFWSWRILLKVILIVTHFLLEVFWCELKKKKLLLIVRYYSLIFLKVIFYYIFCKEIFSSIRTSF